MKIVRAGRAAGRRRLRAARRARPGARAPGRSQGLSRGHASSSDDIWPAYVDRVLSFVDVSAIRPLKVVIDAANGMAGAMLPPVLERLPIEAVRCFFEPDGTLPEPRAEPAAAREPRVHRPRRRSRRAPTSASRSTATPTAASSSTTRASSSPATSRPRCSPRSCSRRSPARRSSTTCARAGPCRRRSSAPAAMPLVNRVGHAFIKQRMREEDAAFARRGLGPLLLPRLLAGRLRRRPVPAHARARSRRAGRSCRSSCARSASATSSPAS